MTRRTSTSPKCNIITAHTPSSPSLQQQMIMPVPAALAHKGKAQQAAHRRIHPGPQSPSSLALWAAEHLSPPSSASSSGGGVAKRWQNPPFVRSPQIHLSMGTNSTVDRAATNSSPCLLRPQGAMTKNRNTRMIPRRITGHINHRRSRRGTTRWRVTRWA